MSNKKKMNPALRILLGILAIAGIAALIYGGIILVLTVTEYKPDPVESIPVENTASETLSVGDSMTVVSWNIGYGALDDSADFFMDGGKRVLTASKEGVLENIDAITEELEKLDADEVFLQEVDLNSKRSCYVDEEGLITSALEGYSHSFAYNYKVLYVPYPLPTTIGKVDCGLVSLSKYEISEASRIALPCPFSYPTRVGNLKRCLLVNRIPIENSDKELVLVNLHLEAYDDGEGKAAQTKQLYELLQNEVDEGNYVIAAGDFNQTFSNTDTEVAPVISEKLWIPGAIDVSDFGQDFELLMDSSKPSCRSLDQPYDSADKTNFQYYIIDGFIVSKNLTIDEMETINLDFENSDHNPIRLTVTLSE